MACNALALFSSTGQEETQQPFALILVVVPPAAVKEELVRVPVARQEY
jgi:hypothetical protein